MVADSSTADTPTTSETRPPQITRERRSRPIWSVPRRCSRVPPSIQAGGTMRCLMSTERGSWGEDDGGEDGAQYQRRGRRPRADAPLEAPQPSPRGARGVRSGRGLEPAVVTVALGPTAIRHPP